MAALVKKYGTAEGDASYAQYGRVGTDASSNCNGAAASSTAPAASQQITAGNSALASFDAANGGVLNGTIQPS